MAKKRKIHTFRQMHILLIVTDYLHNPIALVNNIALFLLKKPTSNRRLTVSPALLLTTASDQC